VRGPRRTHRAHRANNGIEKFHGTFRVPIAGVGLVKNIVNSVKILAKKTNKQTNKQTNKKKKKNVKNHKNEQSLSKTQNQ
jgi:hypothetical protein